ncbi:MAG: AAA family ATPase [Rhodobacteraceae bacterium TMED111]|nr:AAA family ATPase [Marinovum sp.]OUV40566.1 MAG: AAA family ATPase [Rhodobacteraceae bacterium TMED111]
MSEYDFKKIEISLDQIAGALERLSPPPSQYPSFENHDAFVWNTAPDQLKPVIQVSRVELNLLVGIDRASNILLENTLKFSEGLSANNALLWGARGMGKSSLIKAVHQKVIDQGKSLKIVELQREDLASVSRLLDILRTSSQRFLLFCDDLSFSHDDQHYKSLKAVLDGGLEGRPENVLFYATSNRRHLMPRDMIENEKSSSINPSEAVEEKVSLSDRFGLWLGFHPCTQDEYLEMISRYCKAYELSLDFDFIKAQAIEWQATRGARSGRVAWQFFVDLAAKTNTHIDN